MKQHEAHANEVRMIRQRFPDPLALVAYSYTSPPFYNYQPHYKAPIFHQQPYQAPVFHHQSPAVFPKLDSGLAVPKFLPTDDPIESLNKAMTFLSTAITLRYPHTNNQLRTSSNPKNQDTIQDGPITLQNVQGRHTQSYTGNFTKGKATGIGVSKNTRNATTNQARVIRYYNCRGEGHVAKLCTQPRRAHNLEWFKEKMMLAQAQVAGVSLDEEQLSFLADARERVDLGPDAQVLTTNTIFQIDDLDAFDSDCDEAPSASVVLMAKLSAYDSDVLSEYSEQPIFVDNSDIDITSDSNVISYDQNLKENKSEVVQAQRIQHVLHSGSALAEKHDESSVIDTEETLILAEESRIKMKEKQNDAIVKEKKVNITPVDYASLNKLYEHFVHKKQLSAEQAF
ncbi:hypothetical protein Tco_0759317 [Tanacetum coccineum]